MKKNDKNNSSDDVLKIIGSTFRNMREARFLTGSTLSRISGLKPQYIYEFERGERNITMKSLLHLCHALNVPAASLFKEYDTYHPCKLSPTGFEQVHLEYEDEKVVEK